MMIPSLIALPLAGSLVEAGASYTTIAAFITTLTMVGFVTLPIEMRELGPKFTLMRNLLGLEFAFPRFIFTLISVLLIGFIIEKGIDQEELGEEVEI